MRKIVIILILIITSNSFAQNTKTSVKVDNTGNLIGIVTKTDLLKEPFSNWFTPHYNNYNISKKDLKSLKKLLKKVDIKVFFGTWCGDSQKQVPIFFKILDAVHFNNQNITLIGVDRNRKTPDNLQEGLDIQRVPTFIFYKNGTEIGRIVEYPIKSIETDMIRILSGKPYKHAYQD